VVTAENWFSLARQSQVATFLNTGVWINGTEIHKQDSSSLSVSCLVLFGEDGLELSGDLLAGWTLSSSFWGEGIFNEQVMTTIPHFQLQ
jgi:hypothetical protein